MGRWYQYDLKVRLMTVQQHLFSERHLLNTELNFLFLVVLSWNRGQPRKECVVARDGGWTEEPCDRLHHWICEKVAVLGLLEAELNKEGL